MATPTPLGVLFAALAQHHNGCEQISCRPCHTYEEEEKERGQDRVGPVRVGLEGVPANPMGRQARPSELSYIAPPYQSRTLKGTQSRKGRSK